MVDMIMYGVFLKNKIDHNTELLNIIKDIKAKYKDTAKTLQGDNLGENCDLQQLYNQ